MDYVLKMKSNIHDLNIWLNLTFQITYALFQTGYLDVRIPPYILDEDDIEGPGSSAMEGGTIRLRCRSTGKPEPKVHWKRKDNRHIVIRSDGAREKQGL